MTNTAANHQGTTNALVSLLGHCHVNLSSYTVYAFHLRSCEGYVFKRISYVSSTYKSDNTNIFL